MATDCYFPEYDLNIEVCVSTSKVFVHASSLACVFLTDEDKLFFEKKEEFHRIIFEKILPSLSAEMKKCCFVELSFEINGIVIKDYEVSEWGIRYLFTYFKDNKERLAIIQLGLMETFYKEVQDLHYQQWQNLYAENSELMLKYNNLLSQKKQIRAQVKTMQTFLQNKVDTISYQKQLENMFALLTA